MTRVTPEVAETVPLAVTVTPTGILAAPPVSRPVTTTGAVTATATSELTPTVPVATSVNVMPRPAGGVMT